MPDTQPDWPDDEVNSYAKAVGLMDVRFWEVHSAARPDFEFTDARQLLEACCEYFAWASSHPLVEMKPMIVDKLVEHHASPKMRAFTLHGLQLFINCRPDIWNDMAEREGGFSDVCTWARQVMFEQKFTGAAAGLLHAGIIQRDLGLVDKSEVNGVQHVKITQITSDTPVEQAADLWLQTLNSPDVKALEDLSGRTTDQNPQDAEDV